MFKRQKVGIGLMDEEGAPLKHGDFVIVVCAGKEYCAEICFDHEEKKPVMVAKLERKRPVAEWKDAGTYPKHFSPDCMDRVGWIGRRSMMLRGVFLIKRSLNYWR